MKKYLYNYISEIEKKIEKNITKSDIEELVTKIGFFSHERLIHLLVTLFFAAISIVFTVLSLHYLNVLMAVVTIILYVMVMFYIKHYYDLENGVQYLYKLYDKMNKKVK